MSQSISLTVHLDEPCQENWNIMEPTEQGRFCNKCEKAVIDFTGFSDQQMLQYFLANPFPVCGRIRYSQRGHTFTNTQPKINRRLSPVAATLLTLTAITTEAAAHNTPHPVAIQQLQQFKKQAASTLTDSVTISGMVKDDKNVPIENAEIVFGDLKLLSDKNGYFKFTLPTGMKKPSVIKFTYGKLEPQVRSYHPVMGTTSYDVVLLYPVHFYEFEYAGGIGADYRIEIPDSLSTPLSFRISDKLDKQTKDFLSNLSQFIKNNPMLKFTIQSWYKTSPKRAANLSRQVLKYLTDSEGISEERLQVRPPQSKKQLKSEVIVEISKTKPEE